MSSLRRGRISAALLWALAEMTATVIMTLKQFAYFNGHKISLQTQEMNQLGAGGRLFKRQQVIACGGRRKTRRDTRSAPPPASGGVTWPVCCSQEYLHCRRAQNKPVFLLMVDASELATRNCPCAVHSTGRRREIGGLLSGSRPLTLPPTPNRCSCRPLTAGRPAVTLTGCSHADQHRGEVKGPR